MQRFAIIKVYDDTGREAIVGEYAFGPRAEQVAAQLNRTAAGCGAAVTYRVIQEVRRPLGCLAGRPGRRVPA